MKVDQPDEPEPEPRGIDGGPWCERCKGTRWLRREDLRRDDPELGKAVRCPDCEAGYLQQLTLERVLGTIPSKYQNCALDNFPITRKSQQEIVALLREWIDDPEQPWLFLWGPTGTGKTSLAVAVLKECVEQLRISGAFKMVPDVLELLRDTYGTRQAYEADERDVLDLLRQVGLLVLDDLGSEYHKPGEDWAAEKLFQVVAGRHANEKRMIVTSNLSLTELRERLGHPRTPSRIEEMCLGRWVLDLTGLPDLRRRRIK